MAADDNDLFRILRAANFADHVSGWNRAVGDAILHVDLEPHRFPAINVALDLILILGSHADHGNVVVSVEPERASVRQVHSFGFSAALPADDGYCARLMCGFQEVAEFCEGCKSVLRLVALLNDHQNFPSPFTG